MLATPKIIAVILNWNELDVTIRCISSLLNQGNVNIDILLIDNNSKDDPTFFLREKFPSIIVTRNKENLGVAGGRNIGISYALEKNYEYVLIFDNDAWADSNMVSFLLNAAEKYKDTAVFGPKILLTRHPNVIWRAGCTSWKWTYLHAGYQIVSHFFRLLKRPIPEIFDTVRGEGQIDRGQYDQVEDISFQIGCAQFIRTSAFSEVGLLDITFSPYGSEDIDFCERLTKKGWKIKYIPSAFCWHRVESSFNDDYNRSYYNSRNILLLARKHLSPIYFAFLFMPDFIFLTIPLISIDALLKKQKNRLKGFFDALLWNYRDIRKRRLFLR